MRKYVTRTANKTLIFESLMVPLEPINPHSFKKCDQNTQANLRACPIKHRLYGLFLFFFAFLNKLQTSFLIQYMYIE